MKRILLLDNYDSFTFNLFHYLESIGCEVSVFRNDELDMNSLSDYDAIVLSPGPGLPKDAGCLLELIEQVVDSKPILGICLGMQALGQTLGGELYNQKCVKHGVEEEIQLSDSTLFRNLNSRITVGLYHSWALKHGQGNYTVTAKNDQGVVMAIENQDKKVYGVQFHPESVLTPEGKVILQNFVDSI